MLLTRAPLYLLPEGSFHVRLACVKHTASVRSEPGSNSPVNNCISWFCLLLFDLTCLLPANLSFKRLLFSFQRPGWASPSPLRQERENIENETLCQSFFTSCCFFSATLVDAFYKLRRRSERRLYRLNPRLSRAFFAFFLRRFCRQRGGNLMELGLGVKAFLQVFSKKN